MIMDLKTEMVTVGLDPDYLTPAIYANLALSHQKMGNHKRAIELAERFRDLAQGHDHQVALLFRSN